MDLTIQPKKINEIKELRESRGQFQGFIMNFLTNISYRISLIDSFKKDVKHKGKINQEFKIAVGQYIASIVTCWETLFRDVFVEIIQIDDSIYQRVKICIKSNNVIITDIESKDITIGEFMSKQYNLQNIDSICQAFNFLLDKNYDTIFEYLSDVLQHNIYFTSKSYVMLLMQERGSLSNEIEKIVRKAFEIRHKVVHDANFYFDFDAIEMMKMEECLVIFPQLFMVWLTHEYKQKGLAFNFKEGYIRLTCSLEKDEGWCIIGTKDLKGKDWEIIT